MKKKNIKDRDKKRDEEEGIVPKNYVYSKDTGIVAYVKLVNDSGIEQNVEVDYLYEKTWLKKEQWKCFKEVEELKSKYPNLSSQFEEVYNTYTSLRCRLMIIKYPLIVEDWSENNLMSIGTITYTSNVKYLWKCPIHKKEFESTIKDKIERNSCVDCLNI